jgi:PAS domain-containing protein
VRAFEIAANLVMALGFLTALVLLETLPLRPRGFGTGGIKVVMGVALSIYTFVGISHVLQYTGVSAVLDPYENYVRLLFIPIVTAGTIAGRLDEQLRQSRSQAQVLEIEHEILMRVVDTTLTGIALLDESGRVKFVNERGRGLLRLVEDTATGGYLKPSWALTRPGMDSPTRDFSPYVSVTPAVEAECTLRWPDGRSLPLTVSSTPITAVDGGVTGAVLAFTERAVPPAS